MMSRVLDRLCRFAVERRSAILIVIGLAALAGIALSGLKIDSGVSAYFNKSSKIQQELDRVDSNFVSDRLLFVVYETDDVFTAGSLGAIRALSERLAELEWVDDVHSLATVKRFHGTNNTLAAVPLVPTPIPASREGLDRIRAEAHDSSIIHNNLVSPNDRVGVAVLRLPPDIADDDLTATVAAVRSALDEQRDGASYHLTGRPALNVDEAAATQRDLQRMVPLSYLVIALILFLFLRRSLAVGIALAGASLSIAASVAVIPLLGGSLNSVTSMVPPVITALAAAMFVHFFSELRKHKNALQTMRGLAVPAFIAALTTSIGFATNAISTMPAIRQFALATGFGVLIAFTVTAVLFGWAARRFGVDRLTPPPSSRITERVDRFLSGLARFQGRRFWVSIAAFGVLVAVIAAGIPRLQTGLDRLRFFDEDTPIRVATDVFERNLGGTGQMIVSIESDEPGQFTEPETLAKLEALREFARDELGADNVLSLADYVKLAHGAFFFDDPTAERIPDTAEGVTQLLLFNGDPKLYEYIDRNYRWARVVIRFREGSSEDTIAKYDRLDAYLAASFPSDRYTAHATGEVRLYAHANETVFSSMLRSLGIAFAIIFALIFALFRSSSTGLVSMPPNILPIVINFGLMGWLGIRLDGATVMFSSIIVGIAVDDTVHFLQHTRAGLREHGDQPRAVSEAIRYKGPAVIGTSLAIGLGFLVVLASSFGPSRSFGLLVCTGVMSALLADLILLPALLLATRTRLGIATGETQCQPNPLSLSPAPPAPSVSRSRAD